MRKTVLLNTKAFFALLRAGLWEKDVNLSEYGEIDFQKLYDFAEEQAVFGLVAAGLEHVADIKVPKEFVLQFVGQTLQIEEQNKAMNYFIGVLVEKMRDKGIYTLMVKGQGVAQCYERPLWRSSGDVDFYLSDDNFKKAKAFFRPLVSSFDPDNEYSSHINMSYDPFIVELHANQHCGLASRINRVMDEIHYDLFCGGNVRSCNLGGTQVFLPSVNNDVLIVFTHFLNDFYRGGLGVRQICDWCRLLWTFKEKIDLRLLESRLRKMGLMTEWKAFGCFAVEYLGMPVGAMPFCEVSNKWERKAEKIGNFILEVGNFGHNRDTSYYANHNIVARKAISFGRRCKDLMHHASIFPLDSIIFLIGITCKGIRSFTHGE